MAEFAREFECMPIASETRAHLVSVGDLSRTGDEALQEIWHSVFGV